jgi:GNAT superfamily N-acetyltransferase
MECDRTQALRLGLERLADPAHHDVAAFDYTLLAGQFQQEAATAAVRKGRSPHFPIPIALLARLAVDSSHQRQGLGAALLHDALSRVKFASTQVAVRAVVVHAIDDRACAFYERFGFRSLTSSPRTLMVTLGDLRAAGY